jgi:tetratricopeptide (TPR) repeat protein
MTIRTVAGMVALCLCGWGQQLPLTWQQEVRRCADANDWAAAMIVVDREIARAPQDMDVRAWRPRVLMWSGKLREAEQEYREILAIVADDPDDWMGLATVYSREGRTQQALQALDRAVELDPTRADIHAARARALRAAGAQNDATDEFNRAVELDPSYVAAREGLLSLGPEPRHELRVGANPDLFNFADANENGGITLTSNWTPRWKTGVAAYGYNWGGTHAEKALASLTGRLPGLGSLTEGGTAAHDNGVIPKNEAFFDYDQGFSFHGSPFFRGLEIVYGQHWYWYNPARILTMNETTLLYLPRDWIWSLRLIEARSHFSRTGAEWRPSGMTRLGFPIANWEQRKLGGNIFFAVGTENFAMVDQIGAEASQTYGGGLRFQFTKCQDVTGFAGYQKRTQDRTDLSFGATYGIRF